MLATGRVLVVTDDAEVADFCGAVLALDGYDTEMCPGPGAARDCPRLHGVPCTLRERADVAVIDLDCDDDAGACSKVPDDGSTVFVRRSVSVPPREELSRAVEDVRRHARALHGAEIDARPVMALELD
jgi:hypothetical protein